jgi:23S rRNA (cytidine1920-2'-O)/16S rRNA (cytidine1409-2'-O)-methyltransferase
MLKTGPKQRADLLLVARGLSNSQSHAQSSIMAGVVFSGTMRIAKPGQLLAIDCPLYLRSPEHDFVSRGGIKLEHGLNQFNINVQSMVAIDIGASTGGFTDVLLKRGAAHVYAIDVGHAQLAWNLRNDSRVVVLERVNARYVTAALVPEPIDVLVCDASFIGLRTLLPASLALCRPGAVAIALIKPQFEASRENVGRNGVVRDPDIHRAVVSDIKMWWNSLAGWQVLGVTESPVAGPAGNKEFLIGAKLHD